MKYTPQQCREAFYQAAANIEARPELYDFMVRRVGGGDDATCMWGHVGRVLGMPNDTSSWKRHGNVAQQLGCDADDIDAFYQPGVGGYVPQDLPDGAAVRLRSFADATWPATQRPDLKECGQSFPALLASLKGEVA